MLGNQTVVIEQDKKLDPLLGSESKSKKEPSFFQKIKNFFHKETETKPISFFVNPESVEEQKFNNSQKFKSNSISTTK
jgi:hypothetical protein